MTNIATKFYFFLIVVGAAVLMLLMLPVVLIGFVILLALTMATAFIAKLGPRSEDRRDVWVRGARDRPDEAAIIIDADYLVVAEK